MRSRKLFAGLAASSLFGLVLPVVSHAAGLPTVTHLQVTAAGSNTVGGTVTFTAQGATSDGASLETAWWVDQPNGQWVQVQPWSTRTTFTLSGLRPGSYEIEAYALTSPEVQAQDWAASVGATKVINVDTSVALTTATAPVSGVVTVTAAATNIHNPVYQWWVDANGQWIQDPYGYGHSNTFTFHETSPDEEVVVYAKRPIAPTNAGTPLGMTATAVSTPGVLLWQADNRAAYEATLRQLEVKNPELAATSGVITLTSLPDTPPPSSVIPNIPTGYGSDGVYGAQALWANESGMLEAGLPNIPPAELSAGLTAAGEFWLDLQGNNPIAVVKYFAPMFSVPSNQVALSGTEATLAAPEYVYTYTENVTLTNSISGTLYGHSFTAPLATRSGSTTPGGLPSVLGMIQVPFTSGHVVAAVPAGSATMYNFPAGWVDVELIRDPAVPGGYLWTVSEWAYQGASTTTIPVTP